MSLRRIAKKNGSVFLMVVFVIALLSSIVMGMLQMNTEEIQLMRNQIYTAQALAVAEAGLNDALYQIRTNPSWTTGFSNKAFNGDSYTVAVTGTLPNRTITSTGTTTQGFVSRVAANVTVSPAVPHIIRINNFRINE
jgi:type II secretory pathway component PulK